MIQSSITKRISTPAGRNVAGLGIVPVDPRVFATTWKTDNAGASNSSQITIPVNGAGSYNCVVSWGDGTSDTITAGTDPKWTHTYPQPGVYQVQILGVFSQIIFNNGGDKLKLLSVDQWGTGTWGAFNSAFYGCANCEFNATDYLLLPASCASAFRACSKFNQSVWAWDTKNVTGFNSMLVDCVVFDQPVNHWNSAKVTNFSYMMSGCSKFNQPIDAWDTSKGTDLGFMLRNCTSFKQSVGALSLAGLNATTRLNSFAQGTDINAAGSTANYDATLVAWAAQLPLAHGFAQSPHFGTAKYSAATGKPARDALVAAGWSFTDGGQA